MKTPILALASAMALSILPAQAQTVELIKYGDMNSWVTRDIKQSRLIGGGVKKLYEIGPNTSIVGNQPYVPMGGSPWGTSNVLASPAGIVKASNAVFPEAHPGYGRCAKLCTMIDSCTALGMVNIHVLVAGSIFLGEMVEPVKSTSNPYSHMVMGVPFDKRPQALVYDYKLLIPENGQRVYMPGLGKKKVIGGSEQAEALVFLQRRWEDENGNVYAKRVGTAREKLAKSTSDWVMNHKLPIFYGDITSSPDFKPGMGLMPAGQSYYTRNSKGKMVPVQEIGWDEPGAQPTHVILMISTSSSEAYVGIPGLTLWVDNVGWML